MKINLITAFVLALPLLLIGAVAQAEEQSPDVPPEKLSSSCGRSWSILRRS